MKLPSPSNIVAIAFALFSMLFMQLALAAYVCPGMTQSSTMASNMSMPGCDGMDTEQVVLCQAHAQDQASKQSLDKPDLPQVSAFIASNWVQSIDVATALHAPTNPTIATLLHVHSSAPPIAIRHCCFRI